jgi:hypothetical protein
MLRLTWKRQDFVNKVLLLENYAKYCLDPDGTGTNTFPMSEPEQQQIIMVLQHWVRVLAAPLALFPFEVIVCELWVRIQV